jgi:hypothetical protein
LVVAFDLFAEQLRSAVDSASDQARAYTSKEMASRAAFTSLMPPQALNWMQTLLRGFSLVFGGSDASFAA